MNNHNRNINPKTMKEIESTQLRFKERRQARLEEARAKQEKRRRDVKFLAVGTVAVGSAAGLLYGLNNLDNDKDPSRYDSNIAPIEQINLQDGAKIRENPNIPSAHDNGNVLISVDLGDEAKSGQLSFSPETTAYEVDTSSNGTWYGFKAEDLAKVLPEKRAEKLSKDNDGIVWVNNQRASVEYTDTK